MAKSILRSLIWPAAWLALVLLVAASEVRSDVGEPAASEVAPAAALAAAPAADLRGCQLAAR